MAGFEITPVGSGLEGIEVHGLTSMQLENDAVRAQLQDLWIKHGVVIFKGMEDSDELHLKLSNVFGKFQVHPLKQTNTDPARLEITNVQYEPGGENGNVYRVDGVELGGWLPLHFDLVFIDKVNHGGLLRPRIIPPVMGGTLFLDKISLYDSLSQDVKKELEGKYVRYKFGTDWSKQKFLVNEVELIRMGKKYLEIAKNTDIPPSLHPLVYEQAETGRKMLNLSPLFAHDIVGMNESESDELLGNLCRRAQTHPAIYTHRWQPGDIVLWDNWRMLHGAEGLPPESGTRWMQRTTLAGDYALGRLEGAPPSELQLVDV